MDKGKTFELEVKNDESIMLFTLLGEIEVAGEKVSEKTAVKLSEGTSLKITSLKEGTVFRSNHASNYISLAGNLNEDKKRIIEEIDEALREENYKPEYLRGF